jgi:hypothetical protein
VLECVRDVQRTVVDALRARRVRIADQSDRRARHAHADCHLGTDPLEHEQPLERGMV